MQKLINMINESFIFSQEYFEGDVYNERFFNWCGKYEDMILRFTYPELTSRQRSDIFNMIVDGYSDEEIRGKY